MSPQFPLDPQPGRILKGSTLLQQCKRIQQKDAPEMTLRQAQINLSSGETKHSLSRGRGFGKRDPENGILYLPLPDSLRKAGSEEQNKTLTCMTE